MTTNYTAIINAHIDQFDMDTHETEMVFEGRDQYFTIINGEDFTADDSGVCYGWRVEYVKDGVVSLGQIHFVYGYIEDEVEKYEKYMDDFFMGARRNGWEPTGRVWFSGYYTEDIEFIEDEGKYEYVFNPVKEFEAP